MYLNNAILHLFFLIFSFFFFFALFLANLPYPNRDFAKHLKVDLFPFFFFCTAIVSCIPILSQMLVRKLYYIFYVAQYCKCSRLIACITEETYESLKLKDTKNAQI